MGGFSSDDETCEHNKTFSCTILEYGRPSLSHFGPRNPNIWLFQLVAVYQFILNNTTANIDIALTRCPIFLTGWLIFMHLELFLPLALSFMTTSQRWWAWWRNTWKTSASSTWTRTWDVFCDALAARFTNKSQVLVCGDDVDVFILLFHHVHRLCNFIMELDVSDRNSWRCINISELARKIGP